MLESQTGDTTDHRAACFHPLSATAERPHDDPDRGHRCRHARAGCVRAGRSASPPARRPSWRSPVAPRPCGDRLDRRDRRSSIVLAAVAPLVRLGHRPHRSTSSTATPASPSSDSRSDRGPSSGSGPTSSVATCSCVSPTARGSRCSSARLDVAAVGSARWSVSRPGTSAGGSTRSCRGSSTPTLSLPFLLFAIALVSLVGPGLTVTVVVIVLFSWCPIARVVRGQVLALREREFVEAARSLGAGRLADHARRRAPQPRGAARGVRHVVGPAGDRLRGDAVVPRPRRDAADGDVGCDARRRLQAVSRRAGGWCSCPRSRCWP